MHDFLTSCIGHLGNVDSQNNATLPNVEHFILQIRKSCLVVSPPISSEMSLSTSKLASSQWQIQVFKNLIFPCKSEFYHQQ